MEQYLLVEDVVDRAVMQALVWVQEERLDTLEDTLEGAAGFVPLSSEASGTFHIRFPPERENELGSVCEYLRAEAIQLQTISEMVTSMVPCLVKLACPSTLLQRVQTSARSLETHLERLLAWTGEARRATVPLAVVEIRDLFSFAEEHLLQRCVWDTYLAARLALQSRIATDPEARDALSIVARDFLVNARLHWELWDWCLSQLSPARVRRLKEAQHGVSDSLRDAFVYAPAVSHLGVGLPSRVACERLLEVLVVGLWDDRSATDSLAS